jgi:hypothetical protein
MFMHIIIINIYIFIHLISACMHMKGCLLKELGAVFSIVPINILCGFRLSSDLVSF